MFTRPHQLSDDTVATVVARGWGVDVLGAEYLAVGFGSHHWIISGANGARWFATVDDLQAKRNEATEPLDTTYGRLDAALLTARRVRDLGLTFVVAPMRSQDGEVLVRINRRFVVALYPWINGRSYGYGAYDDEADREAVLEMLGRLHSVDLSDVPEARRENFTVPNRAALLVAMQDRDCTWETGPYGEQARLLLCERADEIAWLFDRYDALVVGAAAQTDRLVLTHGEPHAANTLASPEGRMLIDWDTALIAPPERDLWMLLGASGSAVPPVYSPARIVDVSRDVLDLYRMLWDLMEIAGYIAFFRSPHSETADAAESWKNLSTYIDVASRWPMA